LALAIIQDMGYDVEALQDMDDEQLQNTMIRALKQYQKTQDTQNVSSGANRGKTVAQQLTEAFIYEEVVLDEREGPISKARKILASKHRIKKALEKEDGRHYYLSQDDVTHLMSKNGYKFDPKNEVENIMSLITMYSIKGSIVKEFVQNADPTFFTDKLDRYFFETSFPLIIDRMGYKRKHLVMW
jgi:hypothetical protein